MSVLNYDGGRRHLVSNDEPQVELIVTGQEEIPQRLSGQPVLSMSPYRLQGVEFAPNLWRATIPTTARSGS